VSVAACLGAARLGNAQTIAPAMPLQASAVDIAMTATSVLGGRWTLRVRGGCGNRRVATHACLD
jgi:hypothetical protein